MRKLIFIILFSPFVLCSQQNFTFMHDGLSREYIYYAPNNLPANSPLVFVGHWFGGNAQDMMNSCDFNTLADQNNFAVCYPQGTTDSWGDIFWNIGYDFHQGVNVDDVGFLVSLAQHLQSTYNLSTTNTFFTGMSNGGEMCYLLACEAGNTFRAVAPVAGGLWLNYLNQNGCNPTTPIPVFVKHGTNDNVTWYTGDLTNSNGYWGAYLSVDSIINIFVSQNSLTNLIIDTLPNINNNQRITVTYKYSSPSTYKEVWLYKYINGGHSWGADDWDIEDEIWYFFNQMIGQFINVAEFKTEKKIVKIIDVLGKEVPIKFNTPIIYIYNDGTVEKKIIID